MCGLYFENVYRLRSRIFIINHVNLEINHDMQVTGIVVTVVFAIIIDERLQTMSGIFNIHHSYHTYDPSVTILIRSVVLL
jgi:hypothetical protein